MSLVFQASLVSGTVHEDLGSSFLDHDTVPCVADPSCYVVV